MAAASPTKPTPGSDKKRRVSQSDLNRGLDHMLERSIDKDADYVDSVIRGKFDLSAFVASMLRDGEIQDALQRRGEAALTRALGRKMPPRSKKFKNLSKTFAVELVELIKESKLFGDDEEVDIDADAIKTAVAVALRVTLDTNLPKEHDHPEYEGTLRLVLLQRARDVGGMGRLAALTGAALSKFGVYDHPYRGENTKVGCNFADVTIDLTLEIPNRLMADDEIVWEIRKNDSMFEAEIVGVDTGYKQNLWAVFESQHPLLIENVPVDNVSFEYPDVKMVGVPSHGVAAAAIVPAPAMPGPAVGAPPGGAPAGAAFMAPLPG